ncbi:MAG: hypothetical protein IJJ01_09655 [Firmicutes bacterium]|nr:hypothetical protein [Bacillota bacterium]
MEFTYQAYIQMLNLLKENGYSIADYKNNEKYDRCAILRHDIDTSIDKAIRLAEIEQQQGVKSTYFVLLGTRFYNIAERDARDKLIRIHKMGHDIGLHFDELNYNKDVDVETAILKEASIMNELLQIPIETVSMHRPSKKTLEADYQLGGTLINSYGDKFFNEFKYVSDSRRRWREDVEEIIRSQEYNKLHILTHAFWYNEEELTIEESCRRFIMSANHERYEALADNITDLGSIIRDKE